MLTMTLRVERREGDLRVEAVAELGAEELLVLAVDARLVAIVPAGAAEAHRAALQVAHPDVARHEEHDVAKVGRLAVVVGEPPVVHHLQQNVEDLRVGLLDLVEQQDRVRRLRDRVRQQAALVEARRSRAARR